MVSISKKTKLRGKNKKFLIQFGEGIEAKFSNVCGKTGQYDVPTELFQKRTSRKNRALISWDTVFSNNLTLEQLNSFEGGVVVEFVNNDFFDDAYKDNELYNTLKQRLGSDENISSIITIRTVDGSASSVLQREAFSKLIDNTKVTYKNQEVTITKDNYMEYKINRFIAKKGCGNETWNGFLYISIRGGQQDTIETHKGEEQKLFNPACEYASSDVIEDINLVMQYFALVSLKIEALDEEQKAELNSLLNETEAILSDIYYNNDSYKGNLLDYVKNHYSVTMFDNQLTDPISLKPICITDFTQKERIETAIDLTHQEAVLHNKFYWDREKRCILSPSRPTNLFWSFHLSNMIQQNLTIEEYFTEEEERVQKRKQILG